MYDYAKYKADVLTDEGQRTFLVVRDNVGQLLKLAGAFRLQEGISTASGDSFLALACIDRLVELREIKCVYDAGATQHRVYVRG